MNRRGFLGRVSAVAFAALLPVRIACAEPTQLKPVLPPRVLHKLCTLIGPDWDNPDHWKDGVMPCNGDDVMIGGKVNVGQTSLPPHICLRTLFVMCPCEITVKP